MGHIGAKTSCSGTPSARHSQVFFKKWRHMPESSRPKPVMVHINYHPDKGDRMKGIIDFFGTSKKDAIMKWPGGSEPGS
jgi:arabinosyltransferase